MSSSSCRLFGLFTSFAFQAISGELSDDMAAGERGIDMAHHAIGAEMKKEKLKGTNGAQNEGKDGGERREQSLWEKQ